MAMQILVAWPQGEDTFVSGRGWVGVSHGKAEFTGSQRQCSMRKMLLVTVANTVGAPSMFPGHSLSAPRKAAH